MRTVNEVSKLTGVSVRTLHHYDAIGLLKPTKVTEAGYRLYDDTALSRLQSILLFRELQFPLKEIKAIIDSPGFDQREAVGKQIELLEMQYRHIGELIDFAREIQTKGAKIMNFDVFDNSTMEQYKEEAKKKWGGTAQYREYENKAAAKNGMEHEKAANRMMELFAELGTLKNMPPEDETVQSKIAELQKSITENYYSCTNDILLDLGEMYVSDERFKQNIDNAGGDGTAEFAKRAITAYCTK